MNAGQGQELVGPGNTARRDTSSDLLLVGIATLVTMRGEGPALGDALARPESLSDAAILVRHGRIVELGAQASLSARFPHARVRDLGGVLVTPGFVDCHTHPVFARSRLKDFSLRLGGESYASIAAQGGGIRSSVRALREASDEALARALRVHLGWLYRHGTVAVECKSGYGLSLRDEVRSLRLVHDAQGYKDMHLVPTCLAAHSVPEEYAGRKGEYLDLVCHTILPAVVAQGLARGADIFIEHGAFDLEDGRRVLECARGLGLRLHVHADQLSASGGAHLAAEYGAASADHLEYIDDVAMAAMARARTTAVLLPGSTFFLGQQRWAPARKLIDAGVAVALATDFNPGSSPIPNPAFIMSLACHKLGMTPLEALTAFTRNAAHCLGIADDYGSIAEGKRAAFCVWELEDPAEIAYYTGGTVLRETLIVG